MAQATIQGDGRASSERLLVGESGEPLKVSLKRAERRRRITAFLLVTPLLVFILVTFILPIGDMAMRSVRNPEVSTHLPRTTEALAQWDGEGLPGEDVYAAFAADLEAASGTPALGIVGARLNYERSGMRSAMQRAGRRADELEPPYKEALIAADERVWGDPAVWTILERESAPFTLSYYVAALDLTYDDAGNIVRQAENMRIYVPLFMRTLWLSLIITGLTLILGFPVAYLMAHQPLRYSNLLMIFVLLPFWTSLLVRTTSWIVLLQQQGVINDILASLGVIGDDGRIQMVYNRIGTIVAMTHILLPFMILPLYSVMRTIPPSYMRAARSLGANQWTAFWRVYVPQTIPGIGAGGVLVFIISIGYYITPALVGGRSGQLISNLIAEHMQRTLNWGLAAALGTMLLFGVIILYFLYNRLIGVDNMKLG